jgi:hypothetical protein
MANPNRGEVVLNAGGTAYTLKFSTNALCEAENILDKPMAAIMGQMDRLGVLRVLMWASLQARQPGTTIEAAGEIMDAAGMKAVVPALTEALNLAFPKPDEKDGDGRP